MLRKLVRDPKDRLTYAALVILSANSGGAFSPIGDVTTIMLWIKGCITTTGVMSEVLLPSIVSVVVPTFLLQFSLKGKLPDGQHHSAKTHADEVVFSLWERNLVFFVGVGGLCFVPVFRFLTGLPPFMGILLVLGLLWTMTEIFYRNKLVDFSFVGPDGKAVVFDYAYITIHGQPGENGMMQGYFDLIHLPYSTSGVLVEAMTFDKFVLNNYLRGFGVNVADSILLRRGEDYDAAAIEKRLGMPCFVKPAADGSSFGVSKVKNADQLAPALRVAFMESEEAMVESYLKGTEISQGIYKTKEKTVVLPATEVVSQDEFFDYDAKYNGKVQEITPARLSDETAKAVAAETSRIYPFYSRFLDSIPSFRIRW